MKSQVARYKHVGTVDRGKIHVLIDFRVLRKNEVQRKLADTQFWATLEGSRLIAIATTKEHSNPPSHGAVFKFERTVHQHVHSCCWCCSVCGGVEHLMNCDT